MTEAGELQIERLLSEAATPLTQLLTQAHLLEVANKPLQAKDVLVVSKRIVRVLEEHGLQLDGAVGETASFDPDRHEPLGADVTIRRDQPVVIRFVGIAFRGRILRKARVEPALDEAT